MSALVELFCGESGAVLCRATPSAIRSVTGQGEQSGNVAYALASGDVEAWADDAALRRFLRGYGAWDDIATADTETLRSRAFWCLACNAVEEPELYGLDLAEGGA